MALQLPRWRAGALPRPAAPPLRRRAARASSRTATHAAAPPPGAPGDAAPPTPEELKAEISSWLRMAPLPDDRDMFYTAHGIKPLQDAMAAEAAGAAPPLTPPLTKELRLQLRASVLSVFCGVSDAKALQAATSDSLPDVNDLADDADGGESAEAHVRLKQWVANSRALAALLQRIHLRAGAPNPYSSITRPLPEASRRAPMPVACGPVLLPQPLPAQRFSWSRVRYVSPLELMIGSAKQGLARATRAAAALAEASEVHDEGAAAQMAAETEAAVAAAAMFAPAEESELAAAVESASAAAAGADTPLAQAQAMEARWRDTLSKLEASRGGAAERERLLRAHLSLELQLDAASSDAADMATVAAAAAARSAARPRGFGGGAARTRPAAAVVPRAAAAPPDDPAATQRWCGPASHTLHRSAMFSPFELFLSVRR
jgi:hypothetical protein